jgi:hypothetical protein
MEGEEQFDDNGLPGPGAPTPLAALDVSQCNRDLLSVQNVGLVY